MALALPASASARGWTTFKQVTGDPGGGRTVTGAKLASDPAGNQVAIWIEQPSPFKVMASYRPVGGDWGAPQTLDNLSTSAPNTDLAVDKNGNFIAVFSETIAGVSVKVYSAFLPAGLTSFEARSQLGGTLGSAVTITAPAAAFDDKGRAFAAYGVTGATTVAGIRPAGSGQSWTLINNGLPTGSAGLDLAVSPLGEATIADYPTGGGALRHYRLQNGGGAWTTLTTPAGVGNPTGTTLLGVDELGRTTTLYLVASTFTGIATQTCPAGIPATCTTRVDLPRLATLVSAGAPSLAVSKSGDAVAAWTENGSVAVSRRTGFTGTFSAPANAGQGATPTVRFDSVESLVALYEKTSNVISFLFSAPGVTPVGPGSPATDPAQAWKSPSAATDGNGNVFGAWVSSSGTAIQSAVYDSLAPAFNTFSASSSTVTTGDVVTFSADASDTWSGVSYAWDFGDGATATGPTATHAYSAPGAYTARVTATDGAGNTASRTQTMTVGSSSNQPVTGGLARPIAGKNVNVEPVSGEVLVKVPGSNQFVPLVAPTQILDGAIIDARKGRVRITIDNGRGGLDTAEFFGGVFRFTQPKVKAGQTWFANLYLFGGSFKGCPAAPKNPKVATLSRKKGKKQSQGKSVRHLWGSGEGAFRTVGRYSSATVRGTTWLTDDRCNGTLTKVTAGKVGVRDFVLRKTIVVKKGKSYFARPKAKSARRK